MFFLLSEKENEDVLCPFDDLRCCVWGRGRDRNEKGLVQCKDWEVVSDT